ncbi:transcription antitermination factor NusB [Corynebacterium sp. ES2794-CONJ1]|uniref:transcription antitermination factor NusB n=1 Tax=unclassified Corynebacterium TaxID=2624378 RepID=UPI00216A1B20|nr:MULTISPECIES: transcription antitermination factor NusB [unclassified Corynebacterium]MCS4489260.1 transcription antitermination factor NusB [Corynebacterium sp. ES2775-CONJ]MCS4491073.1 transcription antitermination factor NusB [Corynebacterium sp. ES2715-CONJ3]MCS4531046.1 transcription antitermination factor NusB [Corynebacterium sp. ES2730-CONJ]MCU9518413.1 transcription antitermination factor NusB [Corynebacterium sp. ES2794-CONJ1]
MPAPRAQYKRHGSRYKARRRAVDFLYESEARDIDPVALLSDRVSLAALPASEIAPVNPYTREIVAGVAEELDRIDSVIASHLSENWELHRISAVDRAILRVAVWELIFNEDVPVKTAIKDGIELASQYSVDDAFAYINGVLDSIAKNIDELRAFDDPDGHEDEHSMGFADALAEAEAHLTDDESFDGRDPDD